MLLGEFTERKANGGKEYHRENKNKFNVSIAEVDSQDLHKTIILGIALVSGTKALGDSIMDKLNSYLQNITDAEIIEIFRETR